MKVLSAYMYTGSTAVGLPDDNVKTVLLLCLETQEMRVFAVLVLCVNDPVMIEHIVVMARRQIIFTYKR